MEQAILGGGCFWCTEAVFKSVKGIISVVPGYAGGKTKHPRYEDVCAGITGHAEVVKIDFDPKEISYEDVLKIFFSSHDPTTKDRQGNDMGSQYRSIIVYMNQTQKMIAEEFIMCLKDDRNIDKITTELKNNDVFYEAEEYHHDYFGKNPQNSYCKAVINPKVKKISEKFRIKMKE